MYLTRLIIDWEKALQEILKNISEAKSDITIYTYMWRNDEVWRLVIHAIEEAIIRNPQIKVNIEKDAFWARVYNIQKLFSFWKKWWDIFHSKVWKDFLNKYIRNINFKLIWPKSLLFTKLLKENNHSKLFIFDCETQDTTLLITWMNIWNEYMTACNLENPENWWWHDYMVSIKWQIPKNLFPNFHLENKKWIQKKLLHWVELFFSLKGKINIKLEILRRIKKARKSVIIEHAYLTDMWVIRKLRSISRKGIKVIVILPKLSDWFYNANMHSIYKLLKPTVFAHKKVKNIDVYLYDGMIHGKVIVVDRETSILWSANLTNWSFGILKETIAVFNWESNNITQDLLTQIDKDILNSTKIKGIDEIPKYSRFFAKVERWFI